MKRRSFLFFMATVAAGVLLASVPNANAQAPRWARRYNKSQVERVIKQLEDGTDQFKKYLDDAMDRSSIDKLPAEDRIWDRVSDLEKSTNALRRNFDRNDSWWETKSDVERVVSDGRKMNQILNRYRQYLNLRGRWANLKRQINALARYYNIQTIR